MAGPQDASLEEILWRSPPHVQMMGGYLHSNNSKGSFSGLSKLADFRTNF
jgi:hypothetical protein